MSPKGSNMDSADVSTVFDDQAEAGARKSLNWDWKD
jgi:hypothetical protein